MEKVRPWCGQPSDRGRLTNKTDVFLFGSKLVFTCILDSFYSAFWRCSRVRYNSAESEPIWMKSGALLCRAGPGIFWA